MPRGVDEVELIGFAVERRIIERDTLSLDGNPSLALEIHGIEHLFSHFPVSQTAAGLNQAIGQSRLAMIDMGNNGKIAYMAQISHSMPCYWSKNEKGAESAFFCTADPV